MSLPAPSKESIKERLNQIRKSNTNTPEQSHELLSNSQNTIALQNQFDLEFNQNSGNVSKDKFGYFIQKANEQFQSYERELAALKRKTTFFDSKELAIASSFEGFTLSPSRKEKFFHSMKKRTEEENATLNDIQNEYNKKMVELFAENEYLRKMVDKMSFEVVNRLNDKISELDLKYKKEMKEKEETLRKLHSMDSVFEQNSQMKEEIIEKDEELNDLNTQQINNINRIETLSNEIKTLNEEIKEHLDNIAQKEKIIQDNIDEINKLKEEILTKDKTIKDKEKYIKEKEDEIKTLYTDNVQWEEKYSIQAKEIENFKRWSLWDQNLIESFKRIEALEIDLQKANADITSLTEENTHIKEKNSELKSSLDKEISDNKRLNNENDNLTLIKIQYEKDKVQFDDYLHIKKENENYKRELTNTVDKYESQIITDRKNFEVKFDDMKNSYESRIDMMTISHEKELNEITARNEALIKEKEEKYEKDMIIKKKELAEIKEQIETYKSTNKEIAAQLDKKTELFTNLKDFNDKMVKKLQEKENLIKDLQKNSSSIQNADVIVDDVITESTSVSSQSTSHTEQTQSKVYSTFDKFAFTKTILIDYLFCLYLYETSVNVHTIIRYISNNIDIYNYTVFQSNSSSFPSVQSEILSDIYFIAYDLIISKRLINAKGTAKKSFTINFEDFDRGTISEIVNALLNNNFINRMKSPKNFEGLLPLFVTKYEKVFDFDDKFSEFINREIVPIVTKRINAQTATLTEDITTLVELTLHNIKDGKVIINGREVYSFDKFYDEYFNMANISNRSVHIDISKKLNTLQAIDNVVNSIKFYSPSEFTVQKCFDNKEGNGVYKVTSAMSLYLNKKLTQLSLLGNTISGVIFSSRIIPMLRSLRELFSIDLSGNELSDDDIKNFCEFLKSNKVIKIVTLSNNKISTNGGFFLADALVKNKTIETLNISHNNINESGIASLLNVLTNNNNTVTNLNIGYNNLKKEDFQAISEYFNSNPNLSAIDISGNTIDPLSANIIGVSLKKAKKLKILKVNRTGLSEESCPQLLNQLNETSISDIELDMNSFGTMGPIIIIGKFKSSPNLKRVSLRQCDLKPMVLDFVAKNLKNCDNLEMVNLEWNLFDDASFEKFCKEMEDNTNIMFKFSKQVLSKNAIDLVGDLKNIILI